jgi:hypothetical protein
MEDFFVFTEAHNCGLILKKCLNTFHKHHDIKVTVFGTPKDFEELDPHPNNILYDISSHLDIINGYNYGHLGTALIFSKVINNEFTTKQKVVHFDSDTIFKGECLNLIFDKITSGYNLVGPYRCYKNNLNGRKDLDNLSDVVQTYIFGFDKEKINYTDNLVGMCQGTYNPYKHPILDFFDPVSFSIIYNGGKVYFLDRDDYGGMDENGNKKNKYGLINEKIDFGNKIIHFAGVGSGMNFYNNSKISTFDGYKKWATSQYVIYQKLFYNENFSGEYDKEKYEIIKNNL